MTTVFEKKDLKHLIYIHYNQLVVNSFEEKKLESEEPEIKLKEAEMEVVNIEDYKKEEKIADNIVDISTKYLNKKSENLNDKLICVVDIAFISIECHSNFMKSDNKKNDFSLNIEVVNHKCHGEGDGLYTP